MSNIRAPLFHHYVAGVRVTSNRSAQDMQAKHATDSEVTVLFSAEHVSIADRVITLNESGFPPSHFTKDGRNVFVDSDDVDDVGRELRRVTPFAAALQGKLTLHGAGVRFGDGAYCLIGESGIGKSTFSSALAQAGLEKIADDLLPCRESSGLMIVLDPLGRELPLRACFFLARSSSLQSCALEPLADSDFMAQLLKNGFGELPASDIWKLQFDSYTRIIAQCKGFRLLIPDDLASLSRSVESFLSQISESFEQPQFTRTADRHSRP